ncbi:MAG: AmmeMemoRadiSam system radical SAM enzyme [Ignavibacteriae bacterium]|nr:MAG: AmmeMemoRadiSam system radical SAM enzyme [Ignavibacteriota bacterium]
MKLAKWWKTKDNGKILCTLCPRYCEIGEGQKGFCYIRENIEGKLYSTGYGRPTGFAIDPIEKKPLSHFLPGSDVLSFGTAGCNLGCRFCQNWSMSKSKLDELNALKISPENVVNLALKYKSKSIAYTYNDPTIFGEYVIDVSELAREKNIKNVLVTAGYINKEARKDIYKYIDAANIDLKAFTETFYQKITYSHLNDILETLLWVKNETDIWLEITTLLIPDENDSNEEIKQLTNWITTNLGKNVPLHFTAFHPDFKMKDKSSTPAETLINARKIALEEGINYCYLGNIHNIESQTTYCPTCQNPIIIRDWHSVLDVKIQNGKCKYCNSKVAGVWD